MPGALLVRRTGGTIKRFRPVSGSGTGRGG